MDPLTRLITELHDCSGPETDELNRAARSLQDGLRRLELLLERLPPSDHPAAGQRWARRRRSLQRARSLSAHALRAVWQAAPAEEPVHRAAGRNSRQP
jgi:hypothetical protein